MPAPEPNDFETEAQRPQRGMLGEFFDFLVNNKKWWLIPALVMLLLLAGLVVLGTTGAAPFIYTLF